MTQTSTLSEEEKKKLYDALAGAYLSEIEQAKLSIDDRQKISSEIIAGVDGLNTFQDQLVFLKKLAHVYPFFKLLLITYSQDVTKDKEKAVMNRLQKYIQQQ